MKRVVMVGICVLGLVLLAYQSGCTGMGIGAGSAPPVLGAGTPADPVQVPFAKGPFKIDGDPADWANVGFMPAPFAKKPASSVKMCWNENGLYVLAVVKDKSIQVDSTNAWEGDCLELFLEKDGAGAIEMSDNAVQYCITPTPEMGEGKCAVSVAQGSKANAGKIATAWKKTADGYVMEMLVPVVTLGPAKVAAGTKINLNFAVDDDGKAIEQFCSDKNADEGYKTPKSWGTVVLKK